jgi:hypothetical protein
MSDEGDRWFLNMALMAVEGGIHDWRAEAPLERPPGPSPGRPTIVEGNAQTLLDLCAANPESDCRVEFEKTTGAGNQRARIRYQAADALAAELTALFKKRSSK